MVSILLVNEFNEDVDVSILSNLSSFDDVNEFKSPTKTILSSLPLTPAFHLLSVPSQIKEPDKIPGDVTSLTSIPPLAAPLPFNEIILSETSTVVESTLVSVPLTNRSPLIVTLEPVNSNPPPTVVSKDSKSLTLISLEDVYVFTVDLIDPLSVSNKSNLSLCSPNFVFCDPLVTSKESNLPSVDDVYVFNADLTEPLSVSKDPT